MAWNFTKIISMGLFEVNITKIREKTHLPLLVILNICIPLMYIFDYGKLHEFLFFAGIASLAFKEATCMYIFLSGGVLFNIVIFDVISVPNLGISFLVSLIAMIFYWCFEIFCMKRIKK